MKTYRIPVGPFATNCVLIEDSPGGSCLVVDPGADAGTIIARIRHLKLTPVDIVLTHGHLDHCMAAVEVAEEFRMGIVMHRADVGLVSNLSQQMDELIGPGTARRMGVTGGLTPSRFVEDGDEIAFGGTKATVIHLPGHSPGGIGLLLYGKPAVLVQGDTIFRDGVGRTDLWGGDWNLLLSSIRERIFTLPGDTIIISGHGAETTVGREQRGFVY